MLTGEPYPLKAVFCAGGNPVVNMQNTRRNWKAFKQLDLFDARDDVQIAIDLAGRIPWVDRSNLPWDDVEGFND